MKAQMIVLLATLAGFTLAGCGGGSPGGPAYDAEHCQDLLRQADELKGKPQRRATVMQRYEIECTG